MFEAYSKAMATEEEYQLKGASVFRSEMII